MQKLNKYTKAELITKLKQNLEYKDQSNFNKLIDIILSFKTLILKLTLITFIFT
jgi:hypothetical protein